jgi:NADP-dependent 3-hydroxy acid dehydrogenase YdfG
MSEQLRRKIMAGKIVAITGASSGMGEAAARYLVMRGDKVVLGARGANRLSAVTDSIISAGGEAAQAEIDVTKRADLEKLVALARERFGRLDVLISTLVQCPSDRSTTLQAGSK